MSSNQNILVEAVKRTAEYDWMEAASLYDKARNSVVDPIEHANIVALMARAYFRAAFQAATRDLFKGRLRLAQGAYENAQSSYHQAGLHGRSRLSEARGLFAAFWIEDNLDQRRKLARQAISILEDAKVMTNPSDTPTLAELQREILLLRFASFDFCQSYSFLKEQVKKALENAETAIVLHRNLVSEDRLECMALALQLTLFHWDDLATHSRKEFIALAREREHAINELVERIRTPYAYFLSAEASATVALVIGGDASHSLKIAEDGLPYAQRTRDKSIVGRTLRGIADSAFWLGVGEEESARMREVLERSASEALEAAESFGVPLEKRDISSSLGVYSEANTLIAVAVETDLSRKKERLRDSVRVARQGMMGESDQEVLGSLSHPLSKALFFLATLESNVEEKSRLLEESLALRQYMVKLADSMLPSGSWDQGVSRNYLALIKAELAGLKPENSDKLELLESACSDMRDCISICSAHPTAGQIPVLAQYAEWYGDVATKLLQLVPESDDSQQATTAYETAIDNRSKIGHQASVAHLRWKLARVYDQLGRHEDASREFQLAAEDYRTGAEKLPGSGAFFAETATYMEAQSLIENARLHHSEERYLLAAEEYLKVADILKGTKQWTPLSKHYLAWSYLEGGEALGRQERPDSAKESFRAAVAAFQESRAQLGEMLAQESRAQLGEMLAQESGLDRTHELRDWLELNNARKYCIARIQLEEAKLLDKKGEREASSSKYQSASKSFKEMMTETQNEQARAELGTLGLLCEAWAKMKEAETKASPELYASAADLFLATEKTSAKEKFRILAMANASICKALEDGTRFRRTRNTELYGEIKKHLEASADYYREAGFKNAADWTRATQRMFDALVYLTEAEVERDPRKKTEHYHLAEKHLHLAAKLYGDAGYQAKRDEALEHLERAREEKALLMSPLDALAGNPVDSTVSISPVSLVRDQAVELERFEEARVVGSVRASSTDLGVGTNTTLELEIANVGKTAATLMKLENVSGVGLELDAQSAQSAQLTVEGNFVDLKGKRLEYMKTHALKIPLKAKRQGSYELRPRVMFVDERGKYKTYEFDPVALNVPELGISGWLKGPK